MKAVAFVPGRTEDIVRQLVAALPAFIDITTPATAEHELAVQHGLGRVPKGYVIVKGDRTADHPHTERYSGDIPDDPNRTGGDLTDTTAWTTEYIYLKFSVTNAPLTIMVY